jgi:hypothetical protein
MQSLTASLIARTNPSGSQGVDAQPGVYEECQSQGSRRLSNMTVMTIKDHEILTDRDRRE